MNITLFQPKKKSNGLVWKILGGAALGLIVTGVVVSFPDIKRYIKISTM